MDVEQQLALSISLQQAGQFAAAELGYQAILANEPEHPDALHLLGVCRFQQGDVTKAAELISKAVRLAPHVPDYINNLGEVASALGDLKLARRCYDEALLINPEYVESHHGIATLYAKQGQTAEAIQWLRRVVALNSQHPSAYVELSRLLATGDHYQDVLRQLHEWLKPRAYVEIGVETGASLRYAQPPTQCVGIDPAPKLKYELTAPTKVFSETSDDFFQQHDLAAELGQPTFDLAFIDGLHHFDAALRDLMNLERFAGPQSVIVLHDCWPVDDLTSARERATRFWTGDTWKVIPLLRKYRPDLTVYTIPAQPTGLGVVLGMNPASTVLHEVYQQAVDEALPLQVESLGPNYEELNPSPGDWESIKQRIIELQNRDA